MCLQVAWEAAAESRGTDALRDSCACASQVQVERARLEDEQQPRRGMAARFGHAALRQLQVQVDGLRARLHAQPVTEISVQRVALHEGHASGLHEVPKEVGCW